jgi:tRNA A-37 threonylcarbamoyl transferase component Bud32
MSANTTNHCSKCGKPLEAEALLGMCPECMMKAGLAPATPATIQVAPDAFVEPPETETKEFVPGTRLGYCGDYELLEEIARGGMGVVYKARQSSLKRIVAVKTIRAGELARESEVVRFRTEAEAAAQLQHPNIVAIHEIGEDRGRHYFSMDFVEGKNLAQIAGGRPVAAKTAAEWLKTIAQAVQYAHQRGVLHRDLKPQNIMVDSAGRPRVTDFGLAKMLVGDSTVTHTGAVMGSPSYMSPEQARGRNDLVGPASDVYSLGAILYESLTGRPPFRGKSPVETLSEVVNDEPRPPRSLNAAAPTELETICLKCLEKEPIRRYPTARELELDLGRFLAGEPVRARPASVARKTVGWCRRHRGVFLTMASILILALMGLAYGLWEQTQLLTWLNEHPEHRDTDRMDLVQLRWRSDTDLKVLFMNGWLITVVLLPLVMVAYRKLASGRPWKNFFEPLRRTPPAEIALLFGVITGLGVAGALLIVAKWIGVAVWEGPSSLFLQLIRFPFIYPLFYVWFAMFMHIVRDQRRIYVGPGVAEMEAVLSPEQLDSIRDRLAAGNFRKAVKQLRQATMTTSSEATRRVLELAEKQVPAEQLAAIHQELFAGRTYEARLLFEAASRVPDPLARRCIAKMQFELFRSQRDKFTGGRLEKTALANATRRVWQGVGIIFLLGLGMWLFPKVRFDLMTLGLGVAFGVLLRAVNWTSGYRRMGLILWLGRWFLFVMLCSWIVFSLLYWFYLFGFYLLKEPHDSIDGMRVYAGLAPGSILGWLWTHLSFKFSAKASGSQSKSALAKLEHFSGQVLAFVVAFATRGEKLAPSEIAKRWRDWNEASYSDDVGKWGLEKARFLSAEWSRITALFFLWMLFFPKVPPGLQLFYLMVGIWLGGFLRKRAWTAIYRRIGSIMKLVSWLAVVAFGWLIVEICFESFIHLRHAHDWRAWMDPGALLLLGMIVGWLWIHLLVRKPKSP